MNVRVVSAAGNGYQVVWVSFNAIWAHWMRSDHHVEVVALEECVKVVWTKVYNVVLFLRITIEVVSEAILFFCLMRVAPKYINHFLLIFRVVTSKFNVEWSWNCFYPFDILNSRTNASMTAENLLLLIRNYSCNRHLVKSFIYFSEHTVGVVDVLT